MEQRVPSDGELVELWRAIEVFLRQHVDDAHGREDLVQETLIRVVGGIHRLRDRRALTGWARRIAYHLAIDRRRSGAEEVGSNLSFSDPLNDSLFPPADHLRDLEERRREWIERLVQSIRSLPALDRALIIGHYFVGFPHAELARRTGLSRANVKVRLFRARTRMRGDLPSHEHYSSFLWTSARYELSRPTPRSPALHRHRA